MLQSHQALNGSALAERLEVDPRTIRRYIMMLQDMGIPIEADAGRYGGYKLRPGFKLPPLMFNDEEAIAVILSLVIARQIGMVAAAPAIEGAIAKLERVLPISLRERVRALQRTVTLHLVQADEPVTAAILGTLSLASYQERQVNLRYQKDTETSERLFDPYGIVSYAGRWYTVGYCHLREALRVFRLDKVLRVDPGTATFTRPPDFDCLAYLLQSIVAIPSRFEIEVLLKTSLEYARRNLPAGLANLEDVGDGVLLRTSLDDLDDFARTLIGLACPFTVRKPAELRTTLKSIARDIAACSI